MTPGAALVAAALPLALAAGLDLYLTVAVLGGALRLGWERPPAGGLADLEAPWILGMAVVLWLVELFIERSPTGALVWNVVHGVIRPLAAALLTVLLLQGMPMTWVLPAAVAAGLVALVSHAARTGWSTLLWVTSQERPPRLLVSAAEDALVLALVALLLDRPEAATALGALVLAAAVGWADDHIRAFGFAVRLVWARTWGSLAPRRWRGPERFPRWVRRALDDDRIAPGGGLRGSPAAAVALPATGTYRSGWVVVRGGPPLFLCRIAGRVRAVELDPTATLDIYRTLFFNRVALAVPKGGAAAVLFPMDGPRIEGLQAEFPAERTPAPGPSGNPARAGR
ncbi:MAG: DUF4126 domain-containing protein [Gemmatimonadetes bacterium]|nr:DUF4126 domain-containing protein [Gemmatimonadota bacterium]